MPPKRKRLLKISLISLTSLLLLILLLPTLLSTSPGKALLLSRINKSLPGHLSADSLSLGWFHGASAQKIQYTDPQSQNKTILTIDSLTTGITVWSYLTGSTIDLNQINITGAKFPDYPNTIITLHITGNADLSHKTIHFTNDSEITALDPKTNQTTRLAIPAGSLLSWGDLATNLNMMFTYDLAQLQPLLHLPEDTILEGSYTMPLHITGSPSKQKDHTPIAGYTLAPTQLSEVRINIEGFNFAQAQIPYQLQNGILTIIPTEVPFQSGGFLHLRGKIDFNQDPPAYIIDTPDDPDHPFIQDLDLNQKIATGKLRFFPLLWGETEQQASNSKITGKLTLRLNSAYLPFSSAAFKAKATLSSSLNIQNLTTDAPFFNQIGQLIGPVLNLGTLAQGKNPLDIKGGNIPDVAFTLAQGKVTYDHLQLGSSFANLTFSGSVGLDNSLALNMQVGMTGINLPIPIALKGTTAKPELTLTSPLPKNNTLDQVGNDVGKTLEKAPDMIENLFNKKKKN